jgi:hypothetical protein
MDDQRNAPHKTKIRVARSQLATALDLFIRDNGSNIGHCLACGGGEVIEGLAEEKSEEISLRTFYKHSLT